MNNALQSLQNALQRIRVQSGSPNPQADVQQILNAPFNGHAAAAAVSQAANSVHAGQIVGDVGKEVGTTASNVAVTVGGHVFLLILLVALLVIWLFFFYHLMSLWGAIWWTIGAIVIVLLFGASLSNSVV